MFAFTGPVALVYIYFFKQFSEFMTIKVSFDM